MNRLNFDNEISFFSTNIKILSSAELRTKLGHPVLFQFQKSSLGLLPRKSLPRALRRPHVKFDDTIGLSSSFSDQSVKPSLNNTTLENQSADKSTLSSKDVSLMISSKNSSSSNTDEVFYSPNTSFNDSENKEEDNVTAEQNISHLIEETAEADKKIDATEEIRDSSSITQSPRARRSYKSKLNFVCLFVSNYTVRDPCGHIH